MNYFNLLIFTACGLVFSVYMFFTVKKKRWRSIVLGLIFIFLAGYAMPDFTSFLRGGVQREVKIIRITKRSNRVPVISLITDTGDKYWTSMAIYNREVENGGSYVICYLPKTKAVIGIKASQDLNSMEPDEFIYHYSQAIIVRNTGYLF